MRRVVLGLMLIPGALAGAYLSTHGGRVAVASPVETLASARLARMLQGDFEAASSGDADGRVGAIARKVCRIDAPALGERVLYAEERFVHGTGSPLSQRLYVVEGESHHRARVREFTLLDPGASRGLCDRPSQARITADDVTERAGCELDATWRSDHFEGATANDRCSSILNGASHTKRDLDVRDGALTVRDQGFDSRGVAVWGHTRAPIRYERRAP